MDSPLAPPLPPTPHPLVLLFPSGSQSRAVVRTTQGALAPPPALRRVLGCPRATSSLYPHLLGCATQGRERSGAPHSGPDSLGSSYHSPAKASSLARAKALRRTGGAGDGASW